MTQNTWQRITLRLPPDCTAFLQAETKRSASSQNSEIIKSIRDRADRQNAERAGAATPARPSPNP